MWKSDDDHPTLELPLLKDFFRDKTSENPGIIPIFHDESTFTQNDSNSWHWYHEEDGPAQLKPKHAGTSIMVSDFIIEGFGFIEETRVNLKIGGGVWWKNKHLMKQIEKTRKYLLSDRMFGPYKDNGNLEMNQYCQQINQLFVSS